MFIGEQEIKKVEGEGSIVKVTFKNNESTEINKVLYDFVATKGKGNGTVPDVIAHKLANKYLLEMSDFGLIPLSVQSVAQGMINLTENYREEAYAKKFGKDNSSQVTLKDIFDEVSGKVS